MICQVKDCFTNLLDQLEFDIKKWKKHKVDLPAKHGKSAEIEAKGKCF